jgi:predicted Zn-dependent peptidase
MAITFQQAQLPNGLTVIAECDDQAHSAAVGYFVKTGARDELTPVMGVSHFLEHMMFKGTPTRTAEQLNRDFDRIGAKNNAYTSGEMTCFHATVLPETLATANEILADMLRPALREEDFTTEKGVILEEIAMYDDNPFWVLYEKAMETYYGAHPLGHRVLGTKESITALRVEQMREYFRTRYSADNTVLALAGKMDFARVVEQVQEVCGGWERTGTARQYQTLAQGNHEFEVRDAKVNRAYTIMIAPAPSATDERRYAASLLSEILGGADNSRLHWALIEPGLADEAQAGFDPRDGTGDMLVFCSCDPDRRDEVWGVVERELATLADSIKEEDLERIRAKFATAVTVGGERPSGRMQRLGRQWLYLSRHTTLEEELERISRVTVGDLRDLVREFPFRPRTVGRLLPE